MNAPLVWMKYLQIYIVSKVITINHKANSSTVKSMRCLFVYKTDKLICLCFATLLPYGTPDVNFSLKFSLFYGYCERHCVLHMTKKQKLHNFFFNGNITAILQPEQITNAPSIAFTSKYLWLFSKRQRKNRILFNNWYAKQGRSAFNLERIKTIKLLTKWA